MTLVTNGESSAWTHDSGSGNRGSNAFLLVSNLNLRPILQTKNISVPLDTIKKTQHQPAVCNKGGVKELAKIHPKRGLTRFLFSPILDKEGKVYI